MGLPLRGGGQLVRPRRRAPPFIWPPVSLRAMLACQEDTLRWRYRPAFLRSASPMHLHKPACHYGSVEMHQRVNDFLIPLETKRCPAPWLRQVFGRDFTTSPHEEEVAR